MGLAVGSTVGRYKVLGSQEQEVLREYFPGSSTLLLNLGPRVIYLVVKKNVPGQKVRWMFPSVHPEWKKPKFL